MITKIIDNKDKRKYAKRREKTIKERKEDWKRVKEESATEQKRIGECRSKQKKDDEKKRKQER